MPTVLPQTNRIAGVGLCPAGRPVCPKCARVLGRVYVTFGGAFVTCCRGRAGRAGGRCGQQAFILAATAGLCLVVPVARHQFERLAAAGLEPVDTLRELGALLEISESGNSGTLTASGSAVRPQELPILGGT